MYNSEYVNIRYFLDEIQRIKLWPNTKTKDYTTKSIPSVRIKKSTIILE